MAAANEIPSRGVGDSPALTDTSGDSLEGSGWVMVEEPWKKKAGAGVDSDARLALKKRVWQMRVCQRKLPSRIVAQLEEDETEDLDEDAVETLSGEVEVLRASLGLHWTWFEEELLAGRYDAQLRGHAIGTHSLSNVLLPPSAAEVYPCTGAAVSSKAKASKRSPASSARSTPQLRPNKSPPGSPQARLQIPQEVWMAAARHRKSNFFGSAVLGHAAGAPGALFHLLTFAEVSDALTLSLTSSAFAGALLDFRNSDFVEVGLPEAVETGLSSASLWRRLGHCAGASGVDESSALLFAGDPAFKSPTWARLQAFRTRLCRGDGKISVVLSPAAELGGQATTLGPFLPSSCGTSDCSRLLVSDGRQNCCVVDVARRREEEVEIDRYCSKRLLRTSLGVHPAEVTTSWPLAEGSCPSSGGGLFAARPAPQKGAAPVAVASSAVFQWLELPDFERLGPRPAELALNPQATPSKSTSAPTSPELAPSAKPKSPAGTAKQTSPANSGKKSPVLKASHPPKAAMAPAAPPQLARVSVFQEQVMSAITRSAEALPAAVTAEALWELPSAQVLVMVRENLVSGQSGRLWLQVWQVPSDACCKDVSFEPLACITLTSQVTCIHVRGQHLLCGLACGKAELRSLPRLEALSAWPSEDGSAVRHVLLRSASSCKGEDVLAVVAKAGGLGAAGRSSPALAKLLPSKAVSVSLGELVSLQGVGESCFAVCSNKHVYAFEAQGALPPMLRAVVELPGAPVRQFQASLYDFFAVLGDHGGKAVSCPWPLAGPRSKELRAPDGDDAEVASLCRLKAWVAGAPETCELSESAEVLALDVGNLFLKGARIESLLLNTPPSGQTGFGFLAVSANGPGVGVFRWGVEANPATARLRSLREAHVAKQAQEMRLETSRRQLARLQQRLQETDKLEAKANEKGLEVLSEAEQAKLQRRSQVELEVERLKCEIGLDDDQAQGSEEDEQEAEREQKEATAQQRREKEKVQKRHHEEKRALQKERRQNRDRKFSS